MIRTKRETPLGFGYRIALRTPPQRELTVVVRGRFALSPGIEPGVFIEADAQLPDIHDPAAKSALEATYEEASLAAGQLPLRGDVYDDDDVRCEGALIYPSDFAEFKPRADFIVIGSCHPPRGATACKVAIELGQYRKELAVIGQRRWLDRVLGGKHSEPEPLECVPVAWAHAFGGPSCPDNPVGRGWEGAILPSIEDPRDLIVDAGQRPSPVGFAPINPTWPLRKLRSGSRYDDDWKRARDPFPPTDYDWSHQNAAPADQQIEGYLHGDETLAFENMHPEARRLEARLPGLRPRAFVAKALRGGGAATVMPAAAGIGVERPASALACVEVPLVLDTVLADLDAGELFVTWRGLTEVREDDLSDIPFMLLAHEDLASDPLPAAGYLERLEAFAADPLGMTGSKLEAMQRLGDEIESGAIDDRIDAVDDERSDAVSEILGPTLGEDEKRELSESIDQMESHDPGTKARLKVELKKVLRNVSDGGGASMPSMRSDGSLGVGAFVRQILRGVSEGQRAAPEEDFSGTNALIESELRAAALPGVEAVDIRVPERNEEPPEPAPGVDLSGFDLSDRDLRGVDLTGANLDGTNLTRADLREAILIGASLVGASLGGADLSGADCRRASLRLAFMTKTRAIATDFSHGDLREAQLDRVDVSDAILDDAVCFALYAHEGTFEGASLRRAALGKAFFDAVQAEGADFSGARLDYAMFRGSGLSYAKFEGAALNHCAFLACRLDAASFVRASGERVSFQQSRLCKLDARYASFQQPQLAEVDAKEADFSSARLRRGRFYKASLHGASLRAADLFQLDLRKASLTGADFRDSNLYRAMLHEAHGVDADFRGARLEGADLRRSNLVMKT